MYTKGIMKLFFGRCVVIIIIILVYIALVVLCVSSAFVANIIK